MGCGMDTANKPCVQPQVTGKNPPHLDIECYLKTNVGVEEAVRLW